MDFQIFSYDSGSIVVSLTVDKMCRLRNDFTFGMCKKKEKFKIFLHLRQSDERHHLILRLIDLSLSEYFNVFVSMLLECCAPPLNAMNVSSTKNQALKGFTLYFNFFVCYIIICG